MNTFGFSHSFMASFRTWDIRIINFTKTCNFKLWQINKKHCSRNPSATILHANFEKTRSIPHLLPGCCVGNYKRVEPGFDPGTSCTQSRNHTSRPHDRWRFRKYVLLVQDRLSLHYGDNLISMTIRNSQLENNIDSRWRWYKKFDFVERLIASSFVFFRWN